MRKILLLLPMIFSITGCNYFSEDKIPETNNAPVKKVIKYNEIGNAESIIRPSVEGRGYKLNWMAKGSYSIGTDVLARVKGKSLGQALTEFQDYFTNRNLKLEREILISHPNLTLGHPPYVLIFVCSDTVYVKEYSSVDFNENKRRLRYGEVKECALPSSVLVTKDEMELKNQNKITIPPVVDAVIQETHTKTESKPQEGYTPTQEDTKIDEDDINSMDFRNIVLTPEFIKELENDTGQKFDINKYNENQRKRYAPKAQQ